MWYSKESFFINAMSQFCDTNDGEDLHHQQQMWQYKNLFQLHVRYSKRKLIYYYNVPILWQKMWRQKNIFFNCIPGTVNGICFIAKSQFCDTNVTKARKWILAVEFVMYLDKSYNFVIEISFLWVQCHSFIMKLLLMHTKKLALPGSFAMYLASKL